MLRLSNEVNTSFMNDAEDTVSDHETNNGSIESWEREYILYSRAYYFNYHAQINDSILAYSTHHIKRKNAHSNHLLITLLLFPPFKWHDVRKRDILQLKNKKKTLFHSHTFPTMVILSSFQ